MTQSVAGVTMGVALVTGASGFIGSHLCRALDAAGFRTHGLLRPGGSRWRLLALPARVTLHEADLRDFSALRAVFAEVCPNAVFHAAAHPAHSDRPLREHVADDVLGTAHLLDVAAEAGVSRIVYLASSTELESTGSPLTEGSPMRPVSTRGATKGAATLLVRQQARTGLPLTLVRPFHVYGPWEAPGRLIGRALLYADEGLALPLSDSDTRLDPIYVEDVAETCLRIAAQAPLAAEFQAAGELDEVQAGLGHAQGVGDIVKAVERVTGRKLEKQPGTFTARSTDGVYRVADPTGLWERLGWRPGTDLDVGLTRTLAWVRSDAARDSGWRHASLPNTAVRPCDAASLPSPAGKVGE